MFFVNHHIHEPRVFAHGSTEFMSHCSLLAVVGFRVTITILQAVRVKIMVHSDHIYLPTGQVPFYKFKAFRNTG
jgi:hypothetical protein